jgi:hypothetical protein
MLTDAAELGIPDIVAAREDLAPWDVIPVLLDELYKKVKFSAEADDDYPGVGFYYANNGIYMWSFDRADFLS